MKFRKIWLSLLVCTAMTVTSVSPVGAAVSESYSNTVEEESGNEGVTGESAIGLGSDEIEEELTESGTESDPALEDIAEEETDSVSDDAADESLKDDSESGTDDTSSYADETGPDESGEDISGRDTDSDREDVGDLTESAEESGTENVSDESVKSGEEKKDDSSVESVPSDESLASVAEAEIAPGESLVGETIRRDIEDGLYILVPKLNSSACIGIKNNSKSDGANVQLITKNGGFAQAFYVKKVSGTSRYTFVNYHTGKALEVKDNSSANGANVIQNEPSGAVSQQWVLSDASSGYLQIRACGKKTVLDLPAAKSTVGTNVQVYAANQTNAQMWKLVKATGKVAAEARLADAGLTKGYYRIDTAGSVTLPVDIHHNSKDNNANIRIFSRQNSGAQIFRIIPVGDGTYTINGYNSGKYFDCADGKAGSNIYQAYAWSNDTQRWYILKDSSTGKYVIRNKESSHVVMSAEGTTAGSNVSQKSFSASDGQYWQVTKISGSSIHVEPKDGIYEFRSGLDGNMCLDISGASSANSANVQLYTANGTDAQRFAITCDGYGLYKIINVNSLKALHLSGNRNVDGTNVVQYQSFNTGAQKWKIVWNSKIGGYQIQSYGKSLVLDLKGGQAKNKTNVRVQKISNSTSQKWVLKKIGTYDGSYHMKVTCSGTTCTFKVYRVMSGVFQEKLSTSGYIGRNGSGKTVEGDGKTPLGTFTVGKAYGIAKDPGSIIPYTKITDSMYWCGRSDSPYYNTLIDASKAGAGDEHLIEYTEAYQYLLDIGYNTACTPKLGSAIFLHCSRNQPTAGCVAIPKEDMVSTLKMITVGTKISIE